ncbi:MAG TPA: sulfotransferase [Polyangiaceae bacterium]|nr:sulfotransferase [Polyangiaceae bacterium]
MSTPHTAETGHAAPSPEGVPMDSLPARMSRVARILRRRHGLYVRPVLLAAFFAVLRSVVWLGMKLDPLFFPRLRRTRARRPIVLVGNPRTGTTFLQRFLVAEGFGSGMNLFLMLYPSLLLQKLLAPILPLLEKVSPARFHSTAAHQTSLTSVETDDVAVLFRYLDGFFLYGFILSFDEEDLLPCVDPRVRDTSARDFAWLDELWRRSLAATGAERNVAKLFSLSARLPRFLETFPEAQILYMARDPVEVIPSSMSLVTGVLDRAFGFWSLPEDVRRLWLERMYRAWIVLLRRFHDDWQSGAIDRERVFIVRYDQMMLDFEALMAAMCRFLAHEMTPALQATVRKRAEKQRSYTSEHEYDLAQFNLTEAQVRRDCAFYYDTFLPPLVAAG